MKSLIFIITCFVFAGTWMACAQTSSNKETDTRFSIQKPDTEWKKQLTEEQYYVLRQKGTEQPYSGKFLLHKEKGKYTCAACGNELFSSDAKFESHCGWPSFDQEIAAGKIRTQEDHSHGMDRTEIMCARCGGHLGHVFNDGPTATGLRYCVNSVSLGFEAEQKSELARDTIVLAGGCFWCMEAVFQEMQGIQQVESGYCGGNSTDPHYSEVSSGTTGHAESIQLIYYPDSVKLTDILKVFFTIHDPTSLNKQGADEGTQYRSAIYYSTPHQEKVIHTLIQSLQQAHVYTKPIVTEIKPFIHFYPAENYHQNYYKQNGDQPYCQMVIKPKVEKFEKIFKELRRKENE